MDRLFSKSSLMALVVAIGVVVWMASGSVTSPGSNPEGAAPRSATLSDDTAAAGGNERASVRVGVRQSNARAIDRVIAVSGRTEPNRSIEIRGEAEGRVIAIDAERGAFVPQGAVLARLDLRDRSARLEEAKAQIEQHRIQYEAMQKLRGQNLTSEVQIAEARARLVSSQAMLEDIELEIERTVIRAPFDGVVQERQIEIGDLVRIGDTIAEFVDTDPIIVVGDVNEREVGDLNPGRNGKAILTGGAVVEGVIRYVAPVANAGTRTFQVELAVPNPGLKVRAGITAELELATEQVYGHLLSPALLTLDDAGTIGVKIVDESSRAKFVPVEILRSDTQGVWVAGLPTSAEIIAIGQGFVVDGQLVEGVPADGITGSAAQL
ncbi:MAG: efflux RND transporter periplasmic adaptor subunit [Gammaproteobacteria bacterium]|jgi:multidrug efflux system membrane fusion protein